MIGRLSFTHLFGEFWFNSKAFARDTQKRPTYRLEPRTQRITIDSHAPIHSPICCDPTKRSVKICRKSPCFLPLPTVHDASENMLETLPTKTEKLSSIYSAVNQKTAGRTTTQSSVWKNGGWWNMKPPLHRKSPHRAVHRQPWTEGAGLCTSDVAACYTASLKEFNCQHRKR